MAMDMFDDRKQAVLNKGDNSRKGSVDEQIAPLLDLINSKGDLYTTSSCAGRIVLFVEPASGLKKDAKWLYVSHDEADMAGIGRALNDLPTETVWLRMEPFIIHVGVRDLARANALMDILREAGLKHSGILTTARRIMVEISGHERLEAPVAEEGRLLVPADYLVCLVEKANRKLRATRRRMQALYSALEKF